jgi:hypothetical protein
MYIGWYISLTNWSRLTELGVEHKNNSVVYFDGVVVTFLLALSLSRAVWMINHEALYSEVPCGFLPYIRTALSIEWLTYFPWRIFKIAEGIDTVFLYALWGILFSIRTYIPAIVLTRKLKVEKKRVSRNFLLKSILGMVITITYAVLLVFTV